MSPRLNSVSGYRGRIRLQTCSSSLTLSSASGQSPQTPLPTASCSSQAPPHGAKRSPGCSLLCSDHSGMLLPAQCSLFQKHLHPLARFPTPLSSPTAPLQMPPWANWALLPSARRPRASRQRAELQRCGPHLQTAKLQSSDFFPVSLPQGDATSCRLCTTGFPCCVVTAPMPRQPL